MIGVQMIGLMDRLLKRENLDLRLTPYKARGARVCVPLGTCGGGGGEGTAHTLLGGKGG